MLNLFKNYPMVAKNHTKMAMAEIMAENQMKMSNHLTMNGALRVYVILNGHTVWVYVILNGALRHTG